MRCAVYLSASAETETASMVSEHRQQATVVAGLLSTSFLMTRTELGVDVCTLDVDGFGALMKEELPAVADG